MGGVGMKGAFRIVVKRPEEERSPDALE